MCNYNKQQLNEIYKLVIIKTQTMKGYRVFLEELSLYNQPQIGRLVEKKSYMKKLITQLHFIEQQTDSIIAQARSCLFKAQNKAVATLSNLNQELERFLSYNTQILQKAQFRCGCGFQTSTQSQYSEHYKKNHQHNIIRGFKQNSSHLITYLGNVYPLTQFSKRFISRTQFQLKENKQIIHSSLITNQNQKEKDYKAITYYEANQFKQQIKTKMKQNKSYNKVQSGNEMNSLKKQQEAKNCRNHGFYCGSCESTFTAYKSFSAHLRVHDYIIHQNSSHIILRRKNKPAEAMAVKSTANQKQRFVCPCNSKNYSREEFVSHVFKWHKGITPRK